MKKYKHIFFDLDRTLWDFETNSRAAFVHLYDKYQLEKSVSSPESLFLSYYKHNEALWELIRKGKIGKDDLRSKRFVLTLGDFGIVDNNLAKSIGDDYMELCPAMPHLVGGSLKVVERLHHHYQLHIITNGFPDVQEIKMEKSGLKPFFNKLITSEEAGWQKPNVSIFHYAVKEVNAQIEECIMVGDDLNVDVIGARNAGMDQVFFNREGIKHEEKVTFEIGGLKELLSIF